ncbi:hypothetical protein ACIBSV_27005 [Embleya sp. NPDC050154]|uniref:hypothetical protein n=1 Tax=unclassified Embleya TaxID=2699296 RepID=UPI00379B18DF
MPLISLLIAAALALSGCSAAGSGSVPLVRNPVDEPVKAPKLVVPAGFDVNNGWQADVRSRAYVVAPKVGALVSIDIRSDIPSAGSESTTRTKTAVVARSATDGKVWWWSQPVTPLQDQERPVLSLITVRDTEMIVLMRLGTIPEDGLSRARRVVVVDSFVAASSGRSVIPRQHLVRDVPEGLTELPARVGDGGVLFRDDIDRRDEAPFERGSVWNPETGEVTPTAPTGPTPRRCLLGSTCAMLSYPMLPTAAGMLNETWQTTDSKDENGLPDTCRTRSSRNEACGRGFEVAGRWNSGSVAPPGRALGVPVSVTKTAVVAAWWTPAEENQPQEVLYVVHDLVTGAVLTQIPCHTPRDDNPDEYHQLLPARHSPDTRYLVVGPLAVDMRGTAVCFAQNDRNNAVELETVSNAGIAYGTIQSSDGSDKLNAGRAALNITTKGIEALPAGVRPPSILTSSSVGVFVTRNTEGREPVDTTLTMYPPPPAVPVPTKKKS